MGPVSAAAAQLGVDSALAAEAHRTVERTNRPRCKGRGFAHKKSGGRWPLPTGGITRFPIKPSTAASVCATQLPSAPLAMFSFAAIS